MQAKSRVNPTNPAVPGSGATRVRVPPKRHGGVVRRAQRARRRRRRWVTDSTRTENFVEFLADLDAQTPTGMQLHCIVDNLATHFTAKVEAFLERPAAHLLAQHPDPRLVAQPGRVVLLDPRTKAAALRRVRLRRPTRRPDHRVHQRLQPSSPAIPLDLRRPPTQGRVTHNDLRGGPTSAPTTSRPVRPHCCHTERKGRPELAGQASGSSSLQSCQVTRPDTARHCRPVCVCPTCSELGREHRPTRETSRRPGSPGHLVRMRPAADRGLVQHHPGNVAQGRVARKNDATDVPLGVISGGRT